MTLDRQTPSIPQIFDRHLLRQRQNRASRHFDDHSFLHGMIIEDVVDRLESVTRSFPQTLVVGPGAHLLEAALTEKCGVETLFEAALRELRADAAPRNTIVLDEEHFPIGPRSFDLVVSIMGLHMVNDLPGVLHLIRQSLRPDGLLIACLPGGNTLTELRACLYQAESEITGGVSPRVIPFAAIRDLGGLLQRAGFTLPVADITTCPITYRKPVRLLSDLRHMGEANVLTGRKHGTLRRDVLTLAMSIYEEKFPDPSGSGVRATFDIVTLTGWAPHPTQQRPQKPGSAKTSLERAVMDQMRTIGA